MPALPTISWNGSRYFINRRLDEARNTENPHEVWPLDEIPDELLQGIMPVSIFDLAAHILKRIPETGLDFADARLPILSGCEICGASLSAYNSYPTKTGHTRCSHCITDALVWFDPAQAQADIFPTPANT